MKFLVAFVTLVLVATGHHSVVAQDWQPEVLNSTSHQPIVQSQVAAPRNAQIGALDNSPIYIPYVEANARIGNAFDIVQGSLFLPIFQTDHELLFADLRYHWAEPRGHEGNYGLGYRSMDHEWVYGVYGFFDRIRTQNTNYFNQLTLGVELMSVNWDFRINGYLPDREGRVAAGGTTAAISGGTVVVQNDEERAYYGVDAEIGRLLAGGAQAELRAFLTGYYFNRTQPGFPEVAGGRIRLEYRMFDLPWLGQGSRLMLGGQYQYDDIRKDVASGLVSLRVPFGPEATRQPTRLQRRMMNPIVRDVNVVTYTGFSAEQAVDISTGGSIFVIDPNTADPSAIVADAPENATLIVNGSVNTTNPIVVGSGRTLRGADAVDVLGLTSGNVTTFNGNAGTIVGLDNTQDVITLASNASVHSLTVSGGRNSLAGDSVTGVTISNVKTSAPDQSGISLTGISGAAIDDSSIDGGIRLGDFSGSITNNTITTENSVAIIATNLRASVNGNSMIGGGLVLENLSDGGLIVNNTFVGNGLTVDSPLIVENVTGGTITGNSFAGFVGDGVQLGTVSGGSILSNTFADFTGDGLNVDSLVAGAISNNTFGSSTTSLRNGAVIRSMTGGEVSGNIFNGPVGTPFAPFAVTGLSIGQMTDGAITGNTFAGSAGTGIQADTLSGGTIARNTFSRVNLAFGVDQIDGGTIDSNTFNGAFTTNAFEINTVAGGEITNNQFVGPAPTGFQLITMTAGTIGLNQFEGSTTNGFRVNDVFTGGTISGNTFNGSQTNAFYVERLEGGVVDGNTFESTSGSAFDVNVFASGNIDNNTFGGTQTNIVDRPSGSIQSGSISGNTFANVTGSIVTLDSFGGSLNNNVFGGTPAEGIRIANLNNGSVSGNTFSPIGSGIEIDSATGSVSNNTITGSPATGIVINTLSGSVSGNTVTGSLAAGINIVTAGGSTVSSNNVSNSASHGIRIGTSSGANINNNTTTNNAADGIRLESVTGSIIDGEIQNNVSNRNLNGINILSLDGSTITDNVAEENVNDGFIFGSWSNGTLVRRNTGNNNGNNGFTWLQPMSLGWFEDATANGNGNNGIEIPSITNGFFRNNSANNNASAGFAIGSTFGQIEGNTATGNADNALP